MNHKFHCSKSNVITSATYQLYNICNASHYRWFYVIIYLPFINLQTSFKGISVKESCQVYVYVNLNTVSIIRFQTLNIHNAFF